MSLKDKLAGLQGQRTAEGEARAAEAQAKAKESMLNQRREAFRKEARALLAPFVPELSDVAFYDTPEPFRWDGAWPKNLLSFWFRERGGGGAYRVITFATRNGDDTVTVLAGSVVGFTPASRKVDGVTFTHVGDMSVEATPAQIEEALDRAFDHHGVGADMLR